MAKKMRVKIHFSEYFDVNPKLLERHGAFNISLINDLPLFIDPFLLFNSKKTEHRRLHDSIIQYVRFLRDKSLAGEIDAGLLKAWFFFPEVKQTWLGFSRIGNSGRGLGKDFAKALHRNLNDFFSDFGEKRVTKGSHLEKLCLIDNGIGRDNISDFTTNLIKHYLLEYTQSFAHANLRSDQRRTISVAKAIFNYETETWAAESYELPFWGEDFILLTPRELLTRDDTWINHGDLLANFEGVVNSVPDDQLRAQFNNYFQSQLPRLPKGKDPSAKERRTAIVAVLRKYPSLLDRYIRIKEDLGDEAVGKSLEKVSEAEETFIQRALEMANRLQQDTCFYDTSNTSIAEARKRVAFLKDVIENKDGYRFFYGSNGKLFKREQDVQILFRLTWYASPSEVDREVNNGRGPVDFKISRGAKDKSLVEFKLASNKKLEMNLQHQVPIYEKANNTKASIKVIIYFSQQEAHHVRRILQRLKFDQNPDIVLIDARRDNKISASLVNS
jgi:hypothetical protein